MCCVHILLFALPQSPFNLVSWADVALESVIEYTAGDMTGVNVSLGSLTLGTWRAEADIRDITTGNPTHGDFDTPYFMKIGRVLAGVSWARLLASHYNLLVINTIRIEDLDMYIEDKTWNIGSIPILTATTNMDLILRHVAENHLAQWTSGKMASLLYASFRYSIKEINIENMSIHVFTKALPNVSVALPTTVVYDIGAKKYPHGMLLGNMVTETVEAVSDRAMEEVTLKLGHKTMWANGQIFGG